MTREQKRQRNAAIYDAYLKIKSWGYDRDITTEIAARLGLPKNYVMGVVLTERRRRAKESIRTEGRT